MRTDDLQEIAIIVVIYLLVSLLYLLYKWHTWKFHGFSSFIVVCIQYTIDLLAKFKLVRIELFN